MQNRKAFLDQVAYYLGLKRDNPNVINKITNLIGYDDFQQNIYNGDNQLKGKYVGNPAAEFVMHLRNLIVYGLGYPSKNNNMPNINKLDDTKQEIYNNLRIKIELKPKANYLKGKDLYNKIADIIKDVKEDATNGTEQMLIAIEELVDTQGKTLTRDGNYKALMVPLTNALYNKNEVKDISGVSIKLLGNNDNDKMLQKIDKIIQQVYQINSKQKPQWRNSPLPL